MKTSIKALSILTICAVTACSSNGGGGSSGGNIAALNSGKEIASVNGTSIKEGYLEFLARINPRVKGQIKNPASRKKIIDNLVEQELLYQASLKQGLDKNEDVQNKAQLYQKVVVAQALLENELEKRTKEYYEKNKQTQFTKVNFSQIEIDFVPAPEKKPEDKKDIKKEEPAATPEQKAAALKKIQDIKTKINGGEDFGKLAEALSDDKASKKKAGDMGAISRDDKRMARLGMDAVTQAVFNLKKGDVSEPIETKKGYHIVKVTSDPQETPFDEAEKTIQFQIQQETKDNLINELKKSASIKFAEDNKADKSKNEEKKKPEGPATAPASNNTLIPTGEPADAPTAAPEAPTAETPPTEPTPMGVPAQ